MRACLAAVILLAAPLILASSPLSAAEGAKAEDRSFLVLGTPSFQLAAADQAERAPSTTPEVKKKSQAPIQIQKAPVRKPGVKKPKKSGQDPRSQRDRSQANPRAVAPKVAPQSPGVLKKGTNPRSGITIKPVIRSAVFVAAENGSFSAGLGVLAPRGRLQLKGSGFGDQKGVVMVEGVPGGFVLEDVDWTDKLIRGTVPAKVGGTILKRYTVRAKVVLAELAGVSNEYKLPFEHPSETRMLKRSSKEVRLLHCGDGQHGVNPRHDCHEMSTGAMRAFHWIEDSGAIGVSIDDIVSDHDSWVITLKDNWVFTEASVDQDQRGDGTQLLVPTLPTRGSSEWEGAFRWSLVPGDQSSASVTYSARIVVARPMPFP